MFDSYTGRRHKKYSMSYSTYLIKLQIFQLILPTIISALKGLADLKIERERERKKERGQKVPMQKKRKTAKSLILD